IGASSHVSARYKISFGPNLEEHSSSGIIISTKAGSTGWLSSVFNMAYKTTGILEQHSVIKQPKIRENQLLFVVREPFRSVRTQIDITGGIINNRNKLIIESCMPDNGIIFSDGIEKDFLKFNSGSIATIGIAEEHANLVIYKGQNTR
ncbi:MAG: sugar kinase, partial [Bacteroidota bacterium]